MKILLFAVNSSHKLFFEKISKNSLCNVDIVYTKKSFNFSIKSMIYIKKFDFSNEVKLRVDDFIARGGKKFLIKIAKVFYILSAYFNYIRYFNLINEKYSHIMLWNGITFRQSIALQIAKKYDIKAIFIENGLLPNRIVVDTKGVNFLNSVPRDKFFFENYQNNKKLPNILIPRKPKNAKKFTNIKPVLLPSEYIFIPFQVDYDTQILKFSPWVKNMEKLFSIIEELTIKTDITFVLKEHPSSKKKYNKIYNKASKNKKILFANGNTTQSLIEKSKAIITINSTVGIEALLFKKKVIVLGFAFYSIDGITKNAKNIRELTNILINLDDWKVNEQLIENFLKYLYYDYLVEGSFKDENSNQIKQIERILKCKNIK